MGCRRRDVPTSRLAHPTVGGRYGGPVKVGRRPPVGETLTGPVTVGGIMEQEPAWPAPGCSRPSRQRQDPLTGTEVPQTGTCGIPLASQTECSGG